MLEPPSATLLKTLAAFHLCTPRELRRCRGYVRRLTRDLPTFDSVWIDGLVQTRRLTAFQASKLEDGKAAQLIVGPCLLLERLGGTSRAETFLARRRDVHELCVLKLTSVAPEHIKPLSEQLAALTARPVDHPAVVTPQAAQPVEWPNPGEWRLVTISRNVSGPHLAELIVRRGRFPIPIVIEIARQLLDGLVALEARGLTHGDIALSNVRITRSGQSVLVDAGHASAVRPEFSFHNILSADRYDGLAPERISNGESPTPASDLYALGCLLWHLLAGRPPFTVGDPLAKVAAHQTKPIPDVREWVPDTPDWLAETLRRWTGMNPALRARSIRSAAGEFGPPTFRGRRRLARFRGEFDRRTPRRELSESTSSSPWPMTVALIFVLSGLALSMLDQGARSFVLSLAKQQPRAISPQTSSVTSNAEPPREVFNDSSTMLESASLTADAEETLPSPSIPPADLNAAPSSQEPLPLPLPTVRGEVTQITLPAGGRFQAEEVAAQRVLEIVGDAAAPAEIVVGERALSLWAEQVRLRHVRVVRASSTKEQRPPLVIVNSQAVEISSSQFVQRVYSASSEPDAKDNGLSSTSRTGAAVAWRPQVPRDRQTHIELNHVTFAGLGPAFYFQLPPAAFTASNVLKVGEGDFVQLHDPGQHDWRLQLRQVTLRQTGSLLRCWPRTEGTPLSRVTFVAHGCVFDVARRTASTDAANSDAALLAWMTRQLPTNWETAIDWQSAGVVIAPGVNVLAWIDPSNGVLTPIDETRLNIDGIVASPLEFTGKASFVSADSELKSHNVPLPSAMTVGIRADQLP